MCLVLVLALAFRLQESTAIADSPPRIQAAVRCLDLLALAIDAVDASVEGFSVEGEGYDSLEQGSYYRPLMDLAAKDRCNEYRLSQIGAWDRGRISALEFDCWLLSPTGERIPRLAFYWDATRGIRIDFEGSQLTVMPEFRAMNAEFWPQEFHGFYRVTPLVALVKHANITGELEIAESQSDRLRIRLPCNPSLDTDALSKLDVSQIPYLEMEFEGTSELRLAAVDYWTAGRGYVHGYRVLDWDLTRDVPFGTRFNYYVNVPLDHALPEKEWEFAKLSFEVKHKREAKPSFDGATAYNVATSVALVGLGSAYYASNLGADVLAANAAQQISGLPTAESHSAVAEALFANFGKCMTSGQERAAREGGQWPPLDQSTLENRIFERMEIFDIENGFCGQVCVAIVAKLQKLPTTFEQIRLRFPNPVLAMVEVIRCLGETGLDYSIANWGDFEEKIDSRPFLLYLGQTKETGHLALAVANGDEFTLWEPPNKKRSIPRTELRSRVPSGVFVVPRDWLSAAWPLRAIGSCLLAVALLLLVLKWTRSRTVDVIVPTVTVLAFLFTVCGSISCSQPRLEAGDLVVVPESLDVRLGWSQTAEVAVPVFNLTSQLVTLRLVNVSCSCLKHQGPLEFALRPRSSMEVLYRATGDALGTRNVSVWMKALSQGASQEITVPVAVTVEGALKMEPSQLTLTGSPTETIDASFTITAPGAEAAAGEQLRVSSDFDGLVIRSAPPRRIVDHSLIEWEYDCAIQFPALPMGVHIGRLFFELPEADTGRSITMTKSIQVLVADRGAGAK
ncbi:MAG: hypothetical protein HOP15_10160 [Planctomycetes bacterium]|nr:hypothetical protein [Planctomycetota bacterium]